MGSEHPQKIMRIALVIGAAVLCATGCVKRGTTGDTVFLHEVQEGETLEMIAEVYYGDPSMSSVLASYNEVNEERVRPGTVLRVPMSDDDVEKRRTREKALVPYNLGLELVGRSSYVDAVSQFRKALEIDSGFADAHYNLGVAYQKMKAYERARDELRTACRLRPSDARYFFALGNANFHLQRYNDAADAFEAVLERDSVNKKALYSLAIAYEKLERYSDARDAWKRYLEVDKRSTWAAEARKHLERLQ